MVKGAPRSILRDARAARSLLRMRMALFAVARAHVRASTNAWARGVPALCPPYRRSRPPLAVVDGQHLLLAPGDRLVQRHAAGRVLREHVGDDVEVPDLLRGRGGRAWPGWRNRDLGHRGNVPVLRVAPVDRMVGQVVEERHVEAVAGFHPLAQVLRLE